MNSANLSTLLRQLVLEHDIVSLPGMGYFEVKDIPSELINNGKGITPPLRKIVFESSVEYKDSVLAENYAKISGISLAEANAQVAELLRQLKKELVDNAKATIPEFGTLYFGESGSFTFEAAAEFDFEADSYCLEPLSLKMKSDVEPAEEVVCESVEISMEENVIDMVDLVEVQEEVEKEESAQVSGVESAAADAEKESKTATVEEKEELPACEVEAETEAEVATDVRAEVAVGPKRRVNRVILVLLAIVGIFILLVILLFLFKEELMPLLEKILYSKEELEILRRANL